MREFGGEPSLSEDREILDAYLDFGRGQTDEQVLATSFEQVSAPICQPRTSFQLHAPLELCARAHVLPMVGEDCRELARQQIFAVGHVFKNKAPKDTELAAAPEGESVDALLNTIRQACSEYDLPKVTACAIAVAKQIPDDDVLTHTLSDFCLENTAGAAHLPIFFAYLHVLPPSLRPSAKGSFPGLANELASPFNVPYPDFSDRDDLVNSPIDVEEIEDIVAGVPHLGFPGIGIVIELVTQILKDGWIERNASLFSRAAVSPEAAHDVYNTFCRYAAFAMLEEPDTYAKYGWSHNLSLPLAIARIHDRAPNPLKALVAAGVAYAGFRSGSATVAIQPQIARQRIADLGSHASEQEWSRLASEASVHTDAHLVKYVSSAMMASDRDPEATGLYFAAAERLLKLWQKEIPDDQIVNSLTAGRAV